MVAKVERMKGCDALGDEQSRLILWIKFFNTAAVVLKIQNGFRGVMNL